MLNTFETQNFPHISQEHSNNSPPIVQCLSWIIYDRKIVRETQDKKKK